jgi:2-iminobutanoate/2-iminopropanoate deaminase
MISRWSPPGVAAPIGQYSHLAAAPFISGQVGEREDATRAGPDARSHTLHAFANIERLLGSPGPGPSMW